MNKNKMMVAVLLALGSLSAAHAADAAPANGKFGWVAKMDLEFGGDEVARVFLHRQYQSIRACWPRREYCWWCALSTSQFKI